MRSVFIFAILLAFSTFAMGADLVSNEDVVLKFSSSGKTENLKKGDTYSYKASEPVMVSSANPEGQRLSILLVPATNSSQIQLSLPPVPPNKCVVDTIQQQETFATQLNEYTLYLFQVQKLIGEGKISDARAELKALHAKFSSVSSLEFLEASLDLIDGKREPALEHVQRGLKQNPNYTDGQDLLKALNPSAGKASTK